ncbi:MAG: GNAT family N-acetyltransferase [Thermoplasmata archaeon]|nr:GNAT family N-acetyltransferase [Thermoplasmata archaeon]
MTVQVLAYAEIPPRLISQLVALGWSDGDPPFDPPVIRKSLALGFPYAEYVGVFAVEHDQVLSQVFVERHTLTTRNGHEKIAGITGVVTRPDAQGRGLSSRLFEEVHRRERKRGLRRALLWTRRSWGAHRLYEKLGYRDLYTPPTALRRLRGRTVPRRPAGYTVTVARRRDARLLETLLRDSTRERIGLVPRAPGSFRFRFAFGWRNPKDHRILRRHGRPVGYFHATSSSVHVGVNEAALRSADDLPVLLDCMERQAAGRWLTIGSTTLVQDATALLRERGYTFQSGSHGTLMVRSLRGAPSAGFDELVETVADPRFSCQRGEVF